MLEPEEVNSTAVAVTQTEARGSWNRARKVFVGNGGELEQAPAISSIWRRGGADQGSGLISSGM